MILHFHKNMLVYLTEVIYVYVSICTYLLKPINRNKELELMTIVNVSNCIYFGRYLPKFGRFSSTFELK